MTTVKLSNTDLAKQLIVERAALRTPELSYKECAAWRKGIVMDVAEQNNTSVGSASGAYNNALKLLMKEDPATYTRFGRPDDKKAWRSDENKALHKGAKVAPPVETQCVITAALELAEADAQAQVDEQPEQTAEAPAEAPEQPEGKRKGKRK